MPRIDLLYITLHLEGRSHPIQALTARESLNAPLWAQIEINPIPGIQPSSLPGRTAAICIPGTDGGQRWLHGQISAARTSETWQLTLHSRLWQGHLLQHSRLFPDLNRRQLIQQLLDEIGYPRDQIDWRIDRPNHDSLPPNPLLQAAETHLDCFNRLLSEAGWNYWFEDQGTGQESLIISDRDTYLPLNLPAQQLPPVNGSTGINDINRLVHIGFQGQLKPQGAIHTNWLHSTTYHATGRGHWHTFAPPLAPDAAQKRVTQQNHSHGQTIEHHLTSHQPRLQTGRTLSIQPGPIPLACPPLSQRVLILSLEHHAQQPHSDQPGPLQYHNQATVTCASHTPYPQPLTLPEHHPLVFPAQISGNPGQPQPDRDGQYPLHSFNHTDVRSRYPGLLLRPYASNKAGWHFPLLGGNRVLITFINGDPNRPLILGILPHQDAPGPVTQHNANQHRLITPAHNELTLDDNPQTPCIRLQSLNSDLHLELNAKDGEPYLRLAAHHGAISLKAAVNLYLQATQNTRHKIKTDRTTQIKNNHHSQIGQSLHWQAGQHLSALAKHQHTQIAGGKYQLQSAQDLHLTAKNNLTIKTAQGHQIKVPQGSLIKKVKGNITIQALQGSITLGNDTAGIKLDQQGIKLYGKTIQLKGKVNLKGTVSYDTSGSNQPEVLPKPEHPSIQPIERLEPILAPSTNHKLLVEPGFHLIEQPITLPELKIQLYGSEASVPAHFNRLNPRLTERLLPGEMVVLGDPNSLACTQQEADLMAVAEQVNAHIRNLSEADAQFIFDRYDLLTFFTGNGSTLAGAASESLKRQLNSINQQLKALERLHQTTFQQHGRLNVPEFFEQRQAIFRQLDFAMGSVLVQRGFSLPDSSNLRRSLGISSKSLVHHWKQAGVGDIPGYATHYQTVSRAGVYARNLGLIGIGLDAGLTGTRILEACTTGTEEHCEVVIYKETGRFAGSTIVSGMGASAGAALCPLLGIGTAAAGGIGGIACAVILGAAGAVIGSNVGSDAGESFGEKVYEWKGNHE